MKILKEGKQSFTVKLKEREFLLLRAMMNFCEISSLIQIKNIRNQLLLHYGANEQGEMHENLHFLHDLEEELLSFMIMRENGF